MQRMVMAACALLGACGGSSDVEPMFIPGGGTGSGSIDGKLFVHVIDEVTGEPLTGATVRLGDGSVTNPTIGMTDAMGLASFEEVSGKQTVTVTAAGHRAGTLIGLDAANATLPLAPTTIDVATAHVEGTIEGWDDLPAPAMNHLTIALVLYSFLDDFEDPANSIPQGMIGDFPVNACLKAGTTSVCNWELETRVGKQIHYAIILDVDTKGTMSNADDTSTLIGYALRTGLDLAEGEQVTGETLTMVPNLQTFNVEFAPSPAGTTRTAALPVLRMGEQGMLLFIFPGMTPDEPSGMVAALTGDLASGRYELIGRAADADEDERLSTTILVREPSLTSTVDLGEWLAIPSVPTASDDTYAFTPIPAANLHTVALADASGEQVWSIVVLDDSSSFILPAISPDPIPQGTAWMKVDASEVEDFDPQDFRVDDLREKILRGSSNSAMFTH
jgi:hypothetical protein